MGHPDGAHTHGSGGRARARRCWLSWPPRSRCKLAGPVLAALAELVRVFLIVAGGSSA